MSLPSKDHVNSAGNRISRRLGQRWRPLALLIAVVVAAYALGLPREITFEAQRGHYNACVAAGDTDCGFDFDVFKVLTPTLLAALAARGVLALVPVFARRLWGRRRDPCAPQTQV